MLVEGHVGGVVVGDPLAQPGRDFPLLPTDAPLDLSVDAPPEALPERVEELAIALVEAQDIDRLEVLLRDLVRRIHADRVLEIRHSLSEKVETPAGKFERCLKTEETSPLEPAVKEYKVYAPGIGIVQEGEAKLVKYGMATSK